MKLLRTIRLDPSDTFVFERAAEPGEWAVSGSFVFSDVDAKDIQGKTRSAFRSGFLGVGSLGWSTLVQIVEATDVECALVIDSLANQLLQHFGAPDRTTAQAAAEEEVSFVASLCNHAADTLIAVHRTSENGEIREAFRTLRRREGAAPFRAFSFLDVEGEDDHPAEHVDLLNLAQSEKK